MKTGIANETRAWVPLDDRLGWVLGSSYTHNRTRLTRALGSPDRRIIFRELLPNTLPPVIAMIALLGSYGILTEASLSFLGVGDPNVVSLGQMLTNGLESATTAWWVPAFPGAAIFVLVVLLNAVGDGLNVALNPRLAFTSVSM